MKFKDIVTIWGNWWLDNRISCNNCQRKCTPSYRNRYISVKNGLIIILCPKISDWMKNETK